MRLKDDCEYATMSTSYGIITHEWKEFLDDSYEYKEVEVEGREKPVAKVEPEVQPVKKEATVEPKPVAGLTNKKKFGRGGK